MPLPRVQCTVRTMMEVVAAFALGMVLCPTWAWPLVLVPPSVLVLAPHFSGFILACASLLLMLAAMTEIVVGIKIPLWLYIQVAILFMGGLLPQHPNQARSTRLALLAAVFLGMTILYLFPWTTRRPFLQAHSKPTAPALET